jgi:hypothetical protein
MNKKDILKYVKDEYIRLGSKDDIGSFVLHYDQDFNEFPKDFKAGINSFCYFCGFELVEKHHIIPRKNGGKHKQNIIGLCPNHHSAIHRGIFDIIYYDYKVYLKDKAGNIIRALPSQFFFRRNLGKKSFKIIFSSNNKSEIFPLDESEEDVMFYFHRGVNEFE